LFFLDSYLVQGLDIEKSLGKVKDVIDPEWMAFPANFIHHQNLV